MSEPAERPLRVLHVITGLQMGGAETMLASLVEHAGPEAFTSEVVSLRALDDGSRPLAERIEALGLRVRGLGMRPERPNPLFVARLARWIREGRPDVVQTWMYHANVIGGAAARLAGVPLVWGIHHDAADLEGLKPGTARLVKASAWASRWMPDAIVCVAEASRETHAELGYDRAKMRVIPNGFSLERFHLDPQARQSIRRELGIPPDAPVLGMFARFHLMKDHAGFLQAAGIVARRFPEAHFVLCGLDVDESNGQLLAGARAAGLDHHLHLLGLRGDVPALLAALDVYVSSSRREAFPMVLGEAMACGVPCAVTDVGDSALLVGDTGRVVPPGDAPALAQACVDLLCLPPEERQALGEAARERVQREYNLEAIVRQYAQLYRSLVFRGN